MTRPPVDPGPAPLSRPLEALATSARLERPADVLTALGDRRNRLADLLRGSPLGHPLHPALTDLPIGFWTSAMVVDLFGGRRGAPLARQLIAWGVVSALPTLVSGLLDVPRLTAGKRRVAALHAVANAAATGAYAASWGLRRGGRRLGGLLTGLGAGAVASAGGYLGGWLAMGDDPLADPDGAATAPMRAGGLADPVDSAERIAEALGLRRVAAAESCTAGRIASALACVPGAVDFFAGSLVGYQDEAKREHLDVQAESVYSVDAVTEMARGACRLFGAEVAVATSGVVGDEPEDGVPPGTVFIATAVDDVVTAHRYRFEGAPEQRCELAAAQALHDLAEALTT